MNTAQAINGEIKVDDWVIAVPKSGFDGLAGYVTAIHKHGTPEHDTDNAADDVHVNFIIGGYSEERQSEIEDDFNWQFTVDKTFDELLLDDIILAPDNLIRVTGIAPDIFQRLLDSKEAAETYCNAVIESMSDPIQIEAARVFFEFQELHKAKTPNSPNKTHYMVKLSPEVLQNASTKDMDRLFKAIPIKGLSFSTLKDEKGIFAFTSADPKARSRRQKSSVLGRLEDKAKDVKAQPTPEAPKNRKRGAL